MEYVFVFIRTKIGLSLKKEPEYDTEG